MPRIRTLLFAPVVMLLSTGCLPTAVPDLTIPGAIESTDAAAAASTGPTYYVDCTAGSDTRAGTTQATAWRTMTRANNASMSPGASLLFKRGCVWSGTRLTVGWSGTASARITIGAYGTGAKPKIRNGLYSNVRVTGAHVTLQNLEVSSDFPTKIGDNGCRQPVANVYGFDFSLGAHHATLQRSTARGMTAGAHISSDSHHIVVQRSSFIGNGTMQRFGGDPNMDLGAWGVLINGNDNELAFNTFSSNRATCTNKGAPPASNATEIFGGSRNNIHHNRSTGERFFAELGGNSTYRPDGNTFSYNQMISSLPSSRFLVTRGVGDSWGPVWRTTMARNTVYLSGAGSDAVVCGKGCAPNVLTMVGNIIWASNKGLYADASFNESRNVFWSAMGTPLIQVPGGLHSTSRIVDPLFTKAGTDLTLRVGSPAANKGSSIYGHLFDLAEQASTKGTAPDLGAFESR